MLIGTISPEGWVTASPGVIYWDKVLGTQWVKEEGDGVTGWHEQFSFGDGGEES